jgi:RES domain-containing protein
MLAHLDDRTQAPSDLVAIEAHIPTSVRVEHVRMKDLPADWRRHPPPLALGEFGERWIRDGRAPVLTVPSVLIPSELNYVLNPRHPRFGAIRLSRPRPFAFDPRLI